MARPQRLLPDIVSITPTNYDRWQRCPRAFLLADLLGLPPSDDGPSGALGDKVHRVLRIVHTEGDCRDRAFVAELLEANGIDDDAVRVMLERHRSQCPQPVDAAHHEVDLARFHRAPGPPFMATARIDVVWFHDGLLDARDYKTGRVSTLRVADDPRARVQAWVLAKYAARRGLELVLRYEHLAPEVTDEPEPFAPEPDDLEAIEEELRAHAERLRAAAADLAFVGIATPEACGRCEFRSLCSHSAVRGEPIWPATVHLPN